MMAASVGEAFAGFAADDFAPVGLAAEHDVGFDERGQQACAGWAGLGEDGFHPESGAMAGIGKGLRIARAIDTGRIVAAAGRRAMQQGDVILQTADGVMSGLAEGASRAHEVEHILALRPNQPAGGVLARFHVLVGGEIESGGVQPPVDRIAGAFPFGGAAAGDLHRIGRSRSGALATHEQIPAWRSVASSSSRLGAAGPRMSARWPWQ